MAEHAPVVVITGSTRGIGYGLAREFLALGCRVVVCGRSQESTDQAVVALAELYSPERLLGKPCDVRDFSQVQALWTAAHHRFGKVDIWINNAGLGTEQQDIWAHSPEEMLGLVETNLVGVLYGIKVAMEGMLRQGGGAIYVMEGLGSDGRRVPGLTLYGTTKRALRYLVEGLVAETKETRVLVGALSPGMVTTDFLLGRYDHASVEWERAKRVFNILADREETVTPWLARKVLGNKKHGARFEWLTPLKAAWRFLTSPLVRRDVIGEE